MGTAGAAGASGFIEIQVMKGWLPRDGVGMPASREPAYQPVTSSACIHLLKNYPQCKWEL